jgi:hypothetical protein
MVETIVLDPFIGTPFQQFPDTYRVVVIVEDVGSQGYRRFRAGNSVDEPREKLLAVDEKAHGTPGCLPPSQVIECCFPFLEVHARQR